MAVVTEKLCLLPFRAADGDCSRLAAFVRGAARDLAADFAPHATELSRTTEAVDFGYERVVARMGSEAQGLELVHQVDVVELGSTTHTADILRVSAYGLPDDRGLVVESIRPPNHPDYLRSIELEVTAEPDEAARVVGAFRAAFAAEVLTDAELDGVLRVARWYLHEPTWELAIERALVVLLQRPADRDAELLLAVAEAKVRK